MTLPISFEDVSYFRNEFRGDLIITRGVIYYFPHTRVSAARFSPELSGKEGSEVLSVLGIFVPILSFAPWAHAAADKLVKVGKFLKRSFIPSTNSPQIRKLNLWSANESDEILQQRLDAYINKAKTEPLDFGDEAVPKPMRFCLDDIEQVSIGLKFKFEAKFDSHDFRVNLLHLSLLKKALKEGGFLDNAGSIG